MPRLDDVSHTITYCTRIGKTINASNYANKDIKEKVKICNTCDRKGTVYIYATIHNEITFNHFVY